MGCLSGADVSVNFSFPSVCGFIGFVCRTETMHQVINFSVSKANFLTTLRSHLNLTCSCYFGSNLFNVDINYSFIYIYLVNYNYSGSY